MNANSQRPTFGKPVRLLICAALACAITAVTTQVIIRSAGQHEYGLASTQQPAGNTATGTMGRLTVARAL